jgi:hypothetical protein
MKVPLRLRLKAPPAYYQNLTKPPIPAWIPVARTESDRPAAAALASQISTTVLGTGGGPSLGPGPGCPQAQWPGHWHAGLRLETRNLKSARNSAAHTGSGIHRACSPYRYRDYLPRRAVGSAKLEGRGRRAVALRLRLPQRDAQFPARAGGVGAASVGTLDGAGVGANDGLFVGPGVGAAAWAWQSGSSSEWQLVGANDGLSVVGGRGGPVRVSPEHLKQSEYSES